MSRKNKSWSKAEKLQILKEATEGGVLETCRKYGVSTANYYNWKKIIEQKGEAGLSLRADASLQRYRELEAENRRLKKLLIERELALEAQKELFKKKFGTDNVRRI